MFYFDLYPDKKCRIFGCINSFIYLIRFLSSIFISRITGISPFGTTPTEIAAIVSACINTFIFASVTISFIYVGILDYIRRAQMLAGLDVLIGVKGEYCRRRRCVKGECCRRRRCVNVVDVLGV